MLPLPAKNETTTPLNARSKGKRLFLKELYSTDNVIIEFPVERSRSNSFRNLSQSARGISQSARGAPSCKVDVGRENINSARDKSNRGRNGNGNGGK